MTEQPLLAEEQLQDLQLWLLQKALKHALSNEIQHLHMHNLSISSIAVIEALANCSAADLDHIRFDPPPLPAPTTKETCLSTDLVTLIEKMLHKGESTSSNVTSSSSSSKLIRIKDSEHTIAVAEFVLDRLSLTPKMMQLLKVDAKEFSDIIDENGDKKRLGKGAFGEVLEKKWKLDKHHVAVKVIEVDTNDEESGHAVPTASGFSPLFHKYCGTEVITQARVYHPNLLPVLCCTEKLRSDGHMAIGMVSELMRCDLDKLIKTRNKRKAPFPLHVAVDIMLQIAKGVKYLHQHNIMHRDLKPQNILISASPDSVLSQLDNRLSVRVKIADFGSSKAIAHNSSSVFQSHTANVGTRIYQAPEVMDLDYSKDTTRYDKMADVYSFAMVCYQILTGKVPFKTDKSPLLSLCHKIQKQHYRPSFDNDGSSSCPNPLLINMITRCWDADPHQRPNFNEIEKFLSYMKVCTIRLAGYEYEDNELEIRQKEMCKESRRRTMKAMEERIYEGPRVVVAIDFGATYSGFSFANLSNPDKVETFIDWPYQAMAGNKPYCKTQTTLYYVLEDEEEGDFKLQGWGWKGLVDYRLAVAQERKNMKSSHSRSKTSRRHNMESEFKFYDITRACDRLIPVPRPRKGLSEERMIVDFLHEISQFALAHLRDVYGRDLSMHNIQWCLTVPAFRSERAKLLMKKYAENAGMVKQQMKKYAEMAGMVTCPYSWNGGNDVACSPYPLHLILESEAAFVYCQRQLKDSLFLRKGDTIMVADIGARTIDLVVHRKTDDDPRSSHVDEVVASYREVGGGGYVDHNFLTEIMLMKIGCFIEYCKQNQAFQEKVWKWWQEVKMEFDGEGYPGAELEDIPEDLARAWREYDEEKGGGAKDEEEYEELRIEASELKEVFDREVEKVVELIERNVRKERVRVLMVVGGFSASPYLRREVWKRFERVVEQVIIPEDPGTAISAGAVYLCMAAKEEEPAQEAAKQAEEEMLNFFNHHSH